MSRNRKRDEAELPPTEVEGPRRRPRPLPASEGDPLLPWIDDWMDDEEMEDEPRDPPTQ